MNQSKTHKSCENSTLQNIDAHEEAKESGTKLHGSSWVIWIVFESVSKSVVGMSWERLGVLEKIANHIVDLDRECFTVLLISHAKHIRQMMRL